ncbi:hypothetical protein TCAL_13651 [Tigriopus californicus]|uniref:Bestrophin homolog n=1 Tax=Tigriopus californicus TaxID=6832 RepID=A0A553PP76_TIGCA|nr:bestrophin-1-like [Tigriopus californicus]TRY79483.1 hypothetical protein TCAL_13651 [Tigriopus californicus]
MTISYSREVFTSTGTSGIFLKLLWRWKGSIYRLVWHDLLIYVVLYSLLSITYRFLLPDDLKVVFENISLYCSNFADLIPVTFVLGFYVSLVIQRWWSQFEYLPWPDSASVWIATCIHGHDDRGRLMRRTIVRYLNLTYVLTMRLICLPVKKRFPTYDHLVEAGIMLENEKKIIENVEASMTGSHPTYWMPLVWAGSIVTRARKENRVRDDFSMKSLLDKLDQYRGAAGMLINYDWVSIPLVYTQVVTLAVYSFLLSTLMGRQFLDTAKKFPGHEVDLVFPIFTFLQFFFYMGWLKVAEALINPFGEDDDDFDTNWLIDRNLQVSYLIVDEMHCEHPELIRDQFWDDIFPELPYTAAAEEFRVEPVIGAAATIEIDSADAEFLPMNDDDDDDEETERDLGSESELPEGKLEGIVIHANPRAGRKSKNQSNNNIKSNLSKINSNATFLAEQGSMVSLAKSPSRPSLVTSMISKMLPSRISQNHLNQSFSGSQMSIFSKASQRKRRRRRQRLNPSVSRMSNLSPSHSPSRQEEMFKMSSMSSLNSNHIPPSESEFSSRQGSKADLTEVLRSDLRSFQKNEGVLRNVNSEIILKDRHEIKRGMSIRSAPSTDHLVHAQNKHLRRKLEKLQQLQAEIINQLDSEIEANHHLDQDSIPADPVELVTSLEERTNLLRNQVGRRRNKSLQGEPPITMGLNMDKSQPDDGTVDPLPTDSPKDASTILPYVSVPSSSRSSEMCSDYGGRKHSNKSGQLDIPHITCTVGLDGQDGKAWQSTNINDETRPPSEEDEEIEEEPKFDKDNAPSGQSTPEDPSYTMDLSTIEEQPELGYQSDSNESDTLLPRADNENGRGNLIQFPNLSTVHEEDSKELEKH